MTTSDGDFGLTQIGQIAITVKDVDRATTFYRDTLGMKFLFSAPNLTFFDCGGVRLMLTVPEKEEFDHPASILYYKVQDIEHAYKTLTGRGIAFEQEPQLVHKAEDHNLWIAAFRDSEGNYVALMSEVPQ
ncbi:VOC family protein [bacterium]|nr:VOC family protein [bacterium]